MSWVFTTTEGVYQWDRARPGPQKTFSTPNGDILSSAMSPAGTDVAVTSKTGITILSLKDGSRKDVKAVKNARLVMYSHDSKLLYYTTKKSTGLEVVETYDLLTDQIINKTNPHSTEIVSFSVSAKNQYILSSSLGESAQLVLYNTTQSKQSQLQIEPLFQFVHFHPKRQFFLAITTHGNVMGYSVTSSRPTNRFIDIGALTATWMDNTTALVACEDGFVRFLNFETKDVVMKVGYSHPAKNIWTGGGDFIVGLKNGRCDVFLSKGSGGSDERRGNVVSINEDQHVIALGYTACKVRSTAQILTKPDLPVPAKDVKVSTSGPILDIFSPLKRKEVDSDLPNDLERKEKRIKESAANLAKSTNKRISTATVDPTKPKSPDLYRNEIRSKERQMDKDAFNALSAKSRLDKSQSKGDVGLVKELDPTSRLNPTTVKSTLQVSTKHNVPAGKMHSPRKSILKNISPVTDVAKDTVTTETARSPRKSILKDNAATKTHLKTQSPRTRKSVYDEETSSLQDVLPDLEMASPVPTFRRKAPESAVIQSASTQPLPSTNHLPTSSTMSPQDADLWTNIAKPKVPVTFPNLSATATTRIVPKLPEPVAPTEPLPAEMGSAILEIQTVLRRDVERLRLDMIRQFVSFRSEMGQKWEGEVGRLRQENEMLKGEIENLKKEAGNRKERSAWKLG